MRAWSSSGAASRPLPPLPLVVLSHGVPLSAELPPEARSALPADFPWDELERVWQELQGELVGLAPGARQVIATESGHYIQLSQPDLVIEAISQVVAAVRDPSTWATPAASSGATPPTAWTGRQYDAHREPAMGLTREQGGLPWKRGRRRWPTNCSG